MIYFDNAATSGFKPNNVLSTVTSVTKYLLANPGRSGHRLSITGAKIVYDTRNAIANLFSANPDRVIFTKNCTESLNIAIFGLIKKGGHVITTTFEHSSVLRPLCYLEKQGDITLDIVSPQKDKPLIKCIQEKITDKTYMICMTAISNVTGEVFPIFEVGKLAKKHSLYFVVDGAQGGGHINIDMKKNNITALALAGHKGLYGIMGSGVLILDDNVCCNPLIMGGTGTESNNLFQPLSYPERLEAGTLNLPAISSLLEGVHYIKDNIAYFGKTLINYTSIMIEELSKIDNVKCYSLPNPAGIVAFEILNISSEQVANILSIDYDIAVRGAYHCAYKTHEFLHTEKNGLVRASLCPQNSTREIATFIKAIKNIAK